MPDNMKIAYFSKNGMLSDVSPRANGASLYDARGIAYQADIIIFDGKSFRLDAPDDIQSLPIPDFLDTGNILEMSYIFKIRCESENNPALIPIFVDKATELMAASHMLWRRRDYLQVIRNFYRLGLYAAGDAFKAKYRKRHRDLFSHPEDREHEAEHLRTKLYFENKNRRYSEYALLKVRYPDIVPATVKGYLQIHSRGTKRFLEIVEKAQSDGISIDLRDNIHFCQKFNRYVQMSYTFQKIDFDTVMVDFSCSDRCLWCLGKDKYGLNCTYKRK